MSAAVWILATVALLLVFIAYQLWRSRADMRDENRDLTADLSRAGRHLRDLYEYLAALGVDELPATENHDDPA